MLSSLAMFEAECQLLCLDSVDHTSLDISLIKLMKIQVVINILPHKLMLSLVYDKKRSFTHLLRQQRHQQLTKHFEFLRH